MPLWGPSLQQPSRHPPEAPHPHPHPLLPHVLAHLTSYCSAPRCGSTETSPPPTLLISHSSRLARRRGAQPRRQRLRRLSRCPPDASIQWPGVSLPRNPTGARACSHRTGELPGPPPATFSFVRHRLLPSTLTLEARPSPQDSLPSEILPSHPIPLTTHLYIALSLLEPSVNKQKQDTARFAQTQHKPPCLSPTQAPLTRKFPELPSILG